MDNKVISWTKSDIHGQIERVSKCPTIRQNKEDMNMNKEIKKEIKLKHNKYELKKYNNDAYMFSNVNNNLFNCCYLPEIDM